MVEGSRRTRSGRKVSLTTLKLYLVMRPGPLAKRNFGRSSPVRTTHSLGSPGCTRFATLVSDDGIGGLDGDRTVEAALPTGGGPSSLSLSDESMAEGEMSRRQASSKQRARRSTWSRAREARPAAILLAYNDYFASLQPVVLNECNRSR